ncbi:MAG: hypothetical protein LWX83_14895 [Anaerolineae bacterium]|nr:hypothetical protein [Anaerolineae bacterium]
MNYHDLFLFERSIDNNEQYEIEAERLSKTINREWFFTPALDWLKERLAEMTEAKHAQVKLVSNHPNRKMITACPIIVSPMRDEKC